ncbi:MAG: hypothetical protein KF763_03045 [Cyclobacteriaceae bacterium]|nr:hypothetical protein [Cyclobacteriaceae bacterium]
MKTFRTYGTVLYTIYSYKHFCPYGTCYCNLYFGDSLVAGIKKPYQETHHFDGAAGASL